MLKSFDGMVEQMIKGPYRKVLFTIYNMADDEGYVRRLGHMGMDVSVDDLEFMKINIDEELSTLIKKGDRRNIAYAFKEYVESDLQGGKSIIEVLVSKEFGCVFVIKPIDYTIEEFLVKVSE